MIREQVRIYVKEYRRRAALVRQFKARQQALRGQRGSSTGLQHSLAMDEILNQLKSANQHKLVGMLKSWNDQLWMAFNAHSTAKAKTCRATARQITAEINGIVDDIPATFSSERAR